ncbi:MAG TPA: hypothetical protein VN915_05545 [Elusimicrobiota bacterium]|nr:hypothetical protein [Elusimicrobiota bacterium]
MRIPAPLALVALLLCGPVRAQTRVGAVDVVPSAPAPVAAAPTVSLAPSLSLGSPLAAPSLGQPALAAGPVALSAASLAPSPVAAAAVPAAPAAAAALLQGKTSAAADGPKAASSGASAESSSGEGRALFDQAASAPARPLDDIVDANASRPLRGTFIQQEHEGNLFHSDAKDSSGDVFRYYGPVEMRPALAADVESGMTGFSKLSYKLRRALQFSGRSAPDAAWRAWPLSAKLDYLDRLEKAVTAERGPEAAWDGKVSLLLERKPSAPGFVTQNPHMEAPPDGLSHVAGARFIQPEIVTDKNHPAASVSEALGRAQRIIGDTAHAGVQFHVFVKAEPKVLLAQMDSLDGALQLVNDVLFAKAAEGSDRNITHNSLMPWHRGRSERVRELLTRAEKNPHTPAAGDADSEKHAFVGFRYWGMEGDKAVVSLEFRGTDIPWKRKTSSMVQGMDSPDLPKRDYSQARAYLTFLSLYAEALARGDAPKLTLESTIVDEAAAEASLRARAAEMGMPESAYDGLGALARRLTDAKTTPMGYLFPFGASAPGSPELRAFENEVLLIAARAKAAEEAGHPEQRAHLRFVFWNAYQDWARRFGARQDARLAQLIRAVAP